ncbi:nucleoside phosphorylase domain-containing protein [Aspergillus granulosus]|uniref:Nucleoside phosphorylase domain-containing protein n=1 Tax=Aspergillus granulosus TaxID=176169 RepID=A0ABR4I1S3_9EURO
MSVLRNSRLRHTDYKVGWVCILEVELIAALSMLDREHERLPSQPNDPVLYSVGQIGNHNVVIAYPLCAGNTPAQTVVENMRRSFPSVQFALLVGIGGGVPFPLRTKAGDVRLGDVIVGRSSDHSPAVVHYHNTRSLGPAPIAPPPPKLLEAAEKAAKRAAQNNAIVVNSGRLNTSLPRLRKFRYPGAVNDKLYQQQDPNQIVQRSRDPRDQGAHPVIHWGKIASGDLVMKNALVRDELARQHGIICFEMEAAGVMTRLSCLVIRGVSDYCDSHKNDMWQGYAATVAAGFAREVCLSYQR